MISKFGWTDGWILGMITMSLIHSKVPVSNYIGFATVAVVTIVIIIMGIYEVVKFQKKK